MVHRLQIDHPGRHPTSPLVEFVEFTSLQLFHPIDLVASNASTPDIQSITGEVERQMLRGRYQFGGLELL